MSQAPSWAALYGPPKRLLDAVIAALAGRQHGVVGRAQLLAAGIEDHSDQARVQASRLHPLYRGVYAVGHRVLTQRGRWMAATLATDGVLSHRSAGALWGVRPWMAGRADGPTGTTRRQGLLLHRAVLAADEITAHGRHPRHHPRPHAPRPRRRPAAPSTPAGHQRGRDPPPRGPAPADRPLPDEARHQGPPRARATHHTRPTSRPASPPSSMTAVSPGPRPTPSSKGRRSTSRGRDRKLIIELDSWEFHRTRAPSKTTAARTGGSKPQAGPSSASPGATSTTRTRSRPSSRALAPAPGRR